MTAATVRSWKMAFTRASSTRTLAAGSLPPAQVPPQGGRADGKVVIAPATSAVARRGRRRLEPIADSKRETMMDVTQATEAYGRALMEAMRTMIPERGVPHSIRLRLCLAMQEAMEPIVREPALQGPAAALIAQLAGLARESYAQDDADRARSVQAAAEEIGRRLAENDRLARETE